MEDEVKRIVWEIEQAWLERRPEDLARWLHEDVVIAPPGFTGHVRGRSAAAASYEEFAASATVRAADFADADVQLWGDVAVATCRFDVEYELRGERCRDTGWDVLVLRRTADTWQVLWRTVVPGPP
jgi:hypothetical protein